MHLIIKTRTSSAAGKIIMLRNWLAGPGAKKNRAQTLLVAHSGHTPKRLGCINTSIRVSCTH